MRICSWNKKEIRTVESYLHPAHGYAILLVYTPKAKDVIRISITSASLPAKKRILTVCVRLFLEKRATGGRRWRRSLKRPRFPQARFQNIFRAKDGVLTELVEFMFSNQFAMARSMTGAQLPPVYTYAVETAIQMTLTELNENLREIYIEAYTQKEASGLHLSRNGEGAAADLRPVPAGTDGARFLRHGDRLGQHHARLHGAPVRRGS